MLSEKLFEHIEHRPDAVAFRHEGQSLTFGELGRRARNYAAGLREHGVRRGDRIAVFLPTSFDLVTALVGHYLAGAIHVPINTRYGAVELEHILQDCRPSFLVRPATGSLASTLDTSWESTAAGLEVEFISTQGTGKGLSFETLCETDSESTRFEPAEDEDIALMIYTSGTTGKSKGVMLPFRAVVSNIDALTRAWHFSKEDDLVLALPLFHVHGLCIGVHGTLLRGSSATLFDTFDARRVVDAFRGRGTVFMGVPTMYARLVEALDHEPELAEPLRDARLFTSGSAALNTAHFLKFEEQTGHRILERYGMSETLLTLSNPYHGERRPGTVGMPVEGCQVRVVDDSMSDTEPEALGQIIVRGRSLMKGYWEDPKKTAEAFWDEWFLTGDVATRSADGYISIVGRSSVDVIKSGGFKISAREIEEVILGHPAISEVAVLGLPDETWGERIVAVVVVREQQDSLLGSLQEFQRERMADFKTVRALAVVDALPRNALGKVQKHRMKTFDFQSSDRSRGS